MKRTKYILLSGLLILLSASTVFAQQITPIVQAPPPNQVYATSADVKVTFKLIHYSTSTTVYALGVVWSTSPDSLNFTINDYSKPGKNMMFNTTGAQGLIYHIGSGGPPVYGSTTGTTNALLPRTTYYVKAFAFATVYTPIRYKDVYSGNTISFTTLPDGKEPIYNNTVSAAAYACLAGNPSPVITGSQPKGGKDSYSYQWQSNTAGAGWQNISGAIAQSYTISSPSYTSPAQVWFRRLVTADSTELKVHESDPVSITFIPAGTKMDVAVQLLPHSGGTTLEAKPDLVLGSPTVKWQSTTDSITWQNVAANQVTGNSLNVDSVVAKKTWYRAIANYASCVTDTSKSIIFTPPPAPVDTTKPAPPVAQVTIGNQTWMALNLAPFKGATVPRVKATEDWIKLTTPGYDWYNSDSIKYAGGNDGAFYNYYAAIASNTCPTGWHVPNNAEWDTLINRLGGLAVAGGELKESGRANWANPNTGATNSVNFTALPAGYRDANTGNFNNQGTYARFWSSSPITNGYPTAYCINHNSGAVFKKNDSQIKPDLGYSIRCIKNP